MTCNVLDYAHINRPCRAIHSTRRLRMAKTLFDSNDIRNVALVGHGASG